MSGNQWVKSITSQPGADLSFDQFLLERGGVGMLMAQRKGTFLTFFLCALKLKPVHVFYNYSKTTASLQYFKWANLLSFEPSKSVTNNFILNVIRKGKLEFSWPKKQFSSPVTIFFSQHTFEIPGSFARRWIKELRKAATEKVTAEQQARQPRT